MHFFFYISQRLLFEIERIEQSLLIERNRHSVVVESLSRCEWRAIVDILIESSNELCNKKQKLSI